MARGPILFTFFARPLVSMRIRSAHILLPALKLPPDPAGELSNQNRSVALVLENKEVLNVSAFCGAAGFMGAVQGALARGTRERFLAALDKVPDVEPEA
jgi:hypothetical protein